MKEMKILLCFLPQWNIFQPPVGIAHLSSSLKKNGYLVKQKDYNIELYSKLSEKNKKILTEINHTHWLNKNYYKKKIRPLIKNFLNIWVKEIIESDYDLIGFSVLSANFYPSLDVIKKIKKNSNKIIVVGGPQIISFIQKGNSFDIEIVGGPQEILFKYKDYSSFLRKNNDNIFRFKKILKNMEYMDFVVDGEGEETLVEIVDAIKYNKDFENIKGIIFKKNKETIYTGKRKLINNLNNLPFPDFSDFPLNDYKEIAIPIVGSRGCINKCTFCAEKYQWVSYRYRTGKNIFDEMKYQTEKYKTYYYYFTDSLINGKIDELESFCDFMINEQINAYWTGKATIRSQMTPELLKKMKKAGCINLEYGMESGSQDVLNSMDKRITSSLASEVIKNTSEAGIKVILFWIVGFPTESEKNFQESLNFLKENQKYISIVFAAKAGCFILRSSDLFDNPEKYKIYSMKSYMNWKSEYSTPKIREERFNKLLEYCKNLSFQTWPT